MTDNPSPEMIEAGIAALNTSDMMLRDSRHATDAALVKRIYAAMQAQQPNPSPIELARHKVAREVEGDSDNPLRVAEANAIYNGQRDNKYPEILAALNPSPADEPSDNKLAELLAYLAEVNEHEAYHALTTLQARLDAMREALDVARKQIVEITCDGTNRLREVGYEADPPERTYIPALDRIDAILAKDGEV